MKSGTIRKFTKSRGGGWLAIWHVRDCGDHIVAYTAQIGFDSDLPLRPWPVLFSERRETPTTKKGMVLAGICWFGIYLGVQTMVD